MRHRDRNYNFKYNMGIAYDAPRKGPTVYK